MSAGADSVTDMRILHTSDWHIGRTFHGHSTDQHLELVLTALAESVRELAVDVVVVAGDVFDHSAPKADAFALLNRAVGRLREAGAVVVLTSGNHDGPARLGHLAEFAARGGVHVRTSLASLGEPVMIDATGADGAADGDAGPVAFYGLPYLHPALLAAEHPEFTGTTHAEALDFAMGLVRADHELRGGRWVVAAHCFAQNLAADEDAGRDARTSDAAEPVRETREDGGLTEERDITRGGLDLVPVSVFDGPDYVALGHIHGRTTFSPRVRYSGAPLRFSFGERDKPRGAWLVELGEPGGGDDGRAALTVEWLDLPVPREVARLRGTLAELLAPGAHEDARDAWVEVVLTDDVLPHEAMRSLRERYPYAVTLAHRPTHASRPEARSYAERVRGRSETELVEEFLVFVRGGAGSSAAEREVLAEAIALRDATEAAR
ncbi:exodeoxyribonuclease I subunit D [Salana multivorans]|uniref:Nuclease SbcCD subunit D n=2 Tax=Salana multivorans TaxID=120377 RepID=A0A3N2D8D5_9MICO|nr:exodeoxyribonuclease I subunit D [Salana multivorans]